MNKVDAEFIQTNKVNVNRAIYYLAKEYGRCSVQKYSSDHPSLLIRTIQILTRSVWGGLIHCANFFASFSTSYKTLRARYVVKYQGKENFNHCRELLSTLMKTNQAFHGSKGDNQSGLARIQTEFEGSVCKLSSDALIKFTAVVQDQENGEASLSCLEIIDRAAHQARRSAREGVIDAKRCYDQAIATFAKYKNSSQISLKDLKNAEQKASLARRSLEHREVKLMKLKRKLSQANLLQAPKDPQKIRDGLQKGIEGGDLDAVKKALDWLDINEVLPNGELPLHYAVRLGKKEIVELFVYRMADPMVKDRQGLTAVDHASLQKDGETVVILLCGKSSQELHKAQKEKSSRSVRKGLKEVQDLTNGIRERQAKGGLMKAQNAAINGDLLEMRELYERHDFKHAEHTSEGLSLVHLAAMGGSVELIEEMVSRGVDLNCKDNKGRTPLHFAAANPNGAVLRRLIELGADPTLRDANGISPLALLGRASAERDPLALDYTHTLLFSVLALQASTAIAGRLGWVSKDFEWIPNLLSLSASVMMKFRDFGSLLGYFDTYWVKGPVAIGILGSDSIPVFRSIFSGWRAMNVATSSQKQLEAGWRNLRSRKWKSSRNILLCGSNLVFSVNQFAVAAMVDLGISARIVNVYSTIIGAAGWVLSK